MKEQPKLNFKTNVMYRQGKISFFIVILFTLVYLLFINYRVIQREFFSFPNTEKIGDNIYKVNLYGYYESPYESEIVDNYHKISVDYLTTIEVRENDSLENIINDISKCSGNESFCEKLKDAKLQKSYFYNDFVRKAIEQENDSLKNFWICINKSKNKKDKKLCKSDIDFEILSQNYIYDFSEHVHHDLDILILKAIYE